MRFLEENPRYIKFFRRTKHPDEYFWPTILLNSPLRGTVVNRHLRFEPFEEGSGRGRVLRKDDLFELKGASSDYFFAKKFDVTVDTGILDLVDEDILGITNP